MCRCVGAEGLGGCRCQDIQGFSGVGMQGLQCAGVAVCRIGDVMCLCPLHQTQTCDPRSASGVMHRNSRGFVWPRGRASDNGPRTSDARPRQYRPPNPPDRRGSDRPPHPPDRRGSDRPPNPPDRRGSDRYRGGGESARGVHHCTVPCVSEGSATPAKGRWQQHMPDPTAPNLQTLSRENKLLH